jgi:hypothetical protein
MSRTRRPRTPAAGNLLLEGTDSVQVKECLYEIGGPVIEDLNVNLAEALRGSEQHTRLYVNGYKQLTHTLLGAVQSSCPDRIVADEGELWIAVEGQPRRAYTELLESCSAQAPFSPWSAAFALGDAVALNLTNNIRLLIGGTRLAEPESTPPEDFDDLSVKRFLRRVRHLLDQGTETPLDRIMRIYGLSKSELGRLFGVSRQAIDGWNEKGVPAERQDKLAAVLSVTDLLERKLKADRIPGVFRRAAGAYDGQSMQDMITADRHIELLDSVRGAFEWHQAA